MMTIRAINLFWLKVPFLRDALIALKKKRPVLILSFPRSGSSWTGSIIGQAPKALYLREPISRIVNNKGCNSVFAEMDEDFKLAVTQIFSSYPENNEKYLLYPSLWRPDRVIGGTLVIKEVSLLSTCLYLKYKPKLIFLYRHPAAVAQSVVRSLVFKSSKSFFVSSPKYKEYLDFSDDFNLGVSLYAYFLSRILPLVENYEDKIYVCFEDLCKDPIEQFRSLFKYAGLTFGKTTENLIERLASFDSDHPYEIFRDTKNVPYRQFRAITPEMALKAREIWERFDLPFYRRDSDWDRLLFEPEAQMTQSLGSKAPLAVPKQCGVELIKRKVHLFWLKVPLLRDVLIASRKKQAILILSFPLCGSSWTASIIGRAPKALYLREPVSRMVKDKGQPSVFAEMDEDFKSASRQVFTSYPEDNEEDLLYPSLWRPDRVIKGTLVVKEVSLLSTSLYLKYNPKLIFLYRHPAAVAQSVIRSFLLKSNKHLIVSSPKYKEFLDFTDDFSLGVSLYAYFLSRVLPLVENYQDKVYVCFEDLCKRPQNNFRDLFEFAGLTFNNATRNMIERLASFDVKHPYNTILRETRNVPYHQYRDISPEMMLRARKIWEQFNLPWYKQDSDWNLQLLQLKPHSVEMMQDLKDKDSHSEFEQLGFKVAQ